MLSINKVDSVSGERRGGYWSDRSSPGWRLRMYLTRYASGDLCWLGLKPDWQGQLEVGHQKVSGSVLVVISPKAVQNPGGLTRWLTRVHFGSLCMPFRYFLSFRSKMVYLSFGSISSSRGISLYQRSIAFAVTPPFFSSAALTVSTTLSTSLSRFRCRAFCGAESRHGIFLHSN